MKSITFPALAGAVASILSLQTSAQETPAKTDATKPVVTETKEKLPADIVAVVDGRKFKLSEVEVQFRKLLASRGMPNDTLPPDQRRGILRMVLEDMISDHLLTEASKGTEIPEPDFNAEVSKLVAARGDLESFAKSQGMSEVQLKEELRRMMRQRRWADAKLADKGTEISDADAKEFYDKNPQYFQIPEQVRASHILFSLDQTAAPEKVTEVFKKAEAAIKRTEKEDFAKLAGELSEEPGAKERGGDLNFFPRQGKMVEPFAEAAFALKKGEVSKEPVRTRFGYHVIKVTDRKEATKNSFEEAKELIKKRQGWDKKRNLIEGLISELRAKAIVEINLPELPATPKPPVSVATPPVSVPPAPRRQPIEAVTPPVSAPPLPPSSDKK